MSKVFDEVSEITGDDSLRADLPSRSMVVNLQVSENKRYDPESGKLENKFPFMFKLTITQRISHEDPIAIPINAAP